VFFYTSGSGDFNTGRGSRSTAVRIPRLQVCSLEILSDINAVLRVIIDGLLGWRQRVSPHGPTTRLMDVLGRLGVRRLLGILRVYGSGGEMTTTLDRNMKDVYGMIVLTRVIVCFTVQPSRAIGILESI